MRREKKKNFTVCLTGRPEVHTHTHNQCSMLMHGVYGIVKVADPQQPWAKLLPHIQ